MKKMMKLMLALLVGGLMLSCSKEEVSMYSESDVNYIEYVNNFETLYWYESLSVLNSQMYPVTIEEIYNIDYLPCSNLYDYGSGNYNMNYKTNIFFDINSKVDIDNILAILVVNDKMNVNLPVNIREVKNFNSFNAVKYNEIGIEIPNKKYYITLDAGVIGDDYKLLITDYISVFILQRLN